MRINKKIILSISIAILLLAACTKSKEDEAESTNGTAGEESILTKNKIVDGFGIQFISAKELVSNDESILQLNFKIENKSADAGSFDSFFLFAENKEKKELKIAPKENFGGELKPGEIKEGSVYYYLEGSAPITVTYNNLDSDETETWEIKEIEE